MSVDRFSYTYAWIKRGAVAELTEDIPHGPCAGSRGIVGGTPDSFLMVPVNFGPENGGDILVEMTQIKKA